MNRRTIRVIVMDRDGSDFGRIRAMLYVCGIYRYVVDHACNRQQAIRAFSEGIHDCYLVDHEAGMSWGLRAFAEDTSSLYYRPVVFLTDDPQETAATTEESLFIPRAKLTIPLLIMSISTALNRDNYQRKPGPTLSITTFLRRAATPTG